MKPRLVILSRGPELYSNKRLLEETEKAGWDVKIIDPLSLLFASRNKSEALKGKGPAYEAVTFCYVSVLVWHHSTA